MRQRGFTLLEVLVAMVVAGLTLTVFMQLLSGSLRLEFRGRQRAAAAEKADGIFGELLAMDMEDPDFPWQGSDGPYSWLLERAVLGDQDDRSAVGRLRQTQRLERFDFQLLENGRPGLRLVRYRLLAANQAQEEQQSETPEPQEPPPSDPLSPGAGGLGLPPDGVAPDEEGQ